jgi:hypothetical protein
MPVFASVSMNLPLFVAGSHLGKGVTVISGGGFAGRGRTPDESPAENLH